MYDDPTNLAGGRSKYFQGISNWSERKDPGPPVNHFSSQAFRDDLQETIRRNGLKKKVSGPGSSQGSALAQESTMPPPLKDSYVSREDILQQKRQSLSSQFLARSMRGSRDALDDLEAIPGPGPGPGSSMISPRAEEPSHKRIAYGHRGSNSGTHTNGHVNGVTPVLVNGRGKSYEPVAPPPAAVPPLEFSGNGGGGSQLGLNPRPTVPQRRRAIEKKLGEHSHSHHSHSSHTSHTGHLGVKSQAPLPSQVSQLEPPPDYSPPPRSRSRSSSPQVDYLMTRWAMGVGNLSSIKKNTLDYRHCSCCFVSYLFSNGN